RWESIHFGKKPETLRDTLDKYLYKANTDTKIRVERSQKKLSQDMDKSINIMWDKFHDDAARTLGDLNGKIQQAKGELNETLGGFRREFAKGYSDLSAELRDTKVITQQQIDTAIKNYRESAEQEVQRIKKSMADYVQRHV
ncbi:hypothetical protein, partial [Neisseria gonorrhoeae]|uniref:hypothetical protein n=1 Tax=Neisseria gonorrhoeae TaxID=485 RepID=UPI00226E501F